MKLAGKISINDYSYDLPEERIAKYPLPERDSSKLLIYKSGSISESVFKNLPDFLSDGGQLFINDTRVIHARLKFRKSTGANIELFCLAPFDPVEYQLSFSQTKTCTWLCMVGNLKKWKNEILHLEFQVGTNNFTLQAEKIELQAGHVVVKFTWNGELSFGEVLDALGNIPLPPYLNRESEPLDKMRYQTIYSDIKGSVAAPTAGLHITENVFLKLKSKNISIEHITLHVGAGTFQPVKASNAMDHKMHSEIFSISIQTLEKLANSDSPVVATGTTTLRTLESLYWLGVKSLKEKKISTNLGQWDHLSLPQNYTAHEGIKHLIQLLKEDNMTIYNAETAIMVVPGYDFKIVQGLITNYHQPKSTLLLLIAAFVGNNWRDIYDFALKNNFRFLSYGDSSLLWRE